MSLLACPTCSASVGEVVQLRKQRDHARERLRHAGELIAEYEALLAARDPVEPVD